MSSTGQRKTNELDEISLKEPLLMFPLSFLQFSISYFSSGLKMMKPKPSLSSVTESVYIRDIIMLVTILYGAKLPPF